jgi:hypothetical protein
MQALLPLDVRTTLEIQPTISQDTEDRRGHEGPEVLDMLDR